MEGMDIESFSLTHDTGFQISCPACDQAIPLLLLPGLVSLMIEQDLGVQPVYKVLLRALAELRGNILNLYTL